MGSNLNDAKVGSKFKQEFTVQRLMTEILTRKSITYNYMLYKGVVVSKINNHYSIIYLGLTN